ncbi:hypothetical protein [Thermaurantiacus sp.]
MDSAWIAAAISFGAMVIAALKLRHDKRQFIFSAKKEYEAELRSWGVKAVDEIDKIGLLFSGNFSDPVDFRRFRSERISALSTLADSGRFFLPNGKVADVGSEKPFAFRGLRHEAVDALVIIHEILKELNQQDDLKDRWGKIICQKRRLVSAVQKAIGPDKYIALGQTWRGL